MNDAIEARIEEIEAYWFRSKRPEADPHLAVSIALRDVEWFINQLRAESKRANALEFEVRTRHTLSPETQAVINDAKIVSMRARIVVLEDALRKAVDFAESKCQLLSVGYGPYKGPREIDEWRAVLSSPSDQPTTGTDDVHHHGWVSEADE